MKLKGKYYSKIILIYFVLLSGVFPLFYTNYYYNIQISKSYFYIVTTLIVGMIILLFALIKNWKVKRIIIEISYENIPFFLFAAWAILSSILSPYGMSSVTGKDGRYIGSLLILFMCLCVSFFSENRRDMNKLAYLFVGAAVMVGIIGTLHFLGVNIGGFADHVPERFVGHYLSTIGNINIFSNYISIAFGLNLAIHCLFFKKISLVFSYILVVSLFAGNSDGGFLGVAIAFLIMPIFFQLPKRIVTILLSQGAVFFLACYTASFLPKFAILKYEGIPMLLAKRNMVYLFVLFVLLVLGIQKFVKEKEHFFKYLRMIYIVLLIVSIVVFVTVFIMTNLNLLSVKSLLIDDNWGSKRGFIWRKVSELYKDAPIIRKIFGYGPDTFKLLTTEVCYEEMIKITGKIYDSAHNDVFHYLITTGLVGAVLWIVSWGTVILCMILRRKKESYPYFCALIVYLAQTLIVPVQPITTPLAYMLAGICLGMSKREN